MKTYLKVLGFDVLLLVALYFVIGDLLWRAAKAGSPHGHTATGYAVSYTYSLFTQIFTMSGGGTTLASPLTLDWVQVIGALLVVVNVWFLYVTFLGRKDVPKPAQDAPVA